MTPHNLSMIFHDYVQLIYAYFQMSGVANVIVGSLFWLFQWAFPFVTISAKHPIVKTANFFEDEMYMFFVVFFSSS